MHITLVHVHVLPEHLEAFIGATLTNARASRAEPGNRRFDVLQSSDDPTRFVLVEAYDSGDSAAGHKQTSHYLAWRDAVTPWMAEPRQGIGYADLTPELF